MLYFGYMAVISGALALLTGAVGVGASLWFTRKIYASIKVKAVKSGVAPPAASAVSVTSIGMKRKSADDIAEWSQRQCETKEQETGTTTAWFTSRFVS
ncbi:hypothetical protein L915_14434 [Phytophthora nicotianae]|uniref:Uncharacterized protein n=1 Tax=Phytophthora nicotianae TaxID=4792 RepID=W2GBT7_PHYNI|nr:hypothetical protein L915_14434 [Phytophthora nicotianae]